MAAMLAAGAVAVVAPGVHAQNVDVDFPLGIGLHLPMYDRVNGLSLPFGPEITIGDNRLVIDPTITYRSQLGKLDASLQAKFNFDSSFSFAVNGERGTFSNDTWIRSDLINTLWAFAFGADSRNYFRADRANAFFSVHKQTDHVESELFVGPQIEDDWSTGWRPGETHQGPFSVFNWRDTVNGMDRPNPVIDRGHIASGLLGGTFIYHGDELKLYTRASFEDAWHTPLGGDFQQFSFHGDAFIPTVLGQGLNIGTHFVTTSGDPTPLQRYVYIGGSGTLATVDLLALGGDRMFFLDTWYRIPVPVFSFPIVGTPFVAPHFAMGAAGVRSFGVPTQNLGLQAGIGTLYLEYLINPRTHKHDFGGGFSLPR